MSFVVTQRESLSAKASDPTDSWLGEGHPPHERARLRGC